MSKHVEDTRTTLTDIMSPYPLTISLENGGLLHLSAVETIGRGSSCIAYHAVDADGRTRIVKELYPLGKDLIGIKRDTATGSLSIPNAALEIFGDRTERFKNATKGFSEYWEWDIGLHTAPRPFAFGESNGTLYAVSDPPAGTLLVDAPPSDMQGIAEVMVSVCEALDRFHGHKDAQGNPEPLLYLDLKPDNAFYYSIDGGSHVLLFDFDTVVSKADIRRLRCRYSTYSAGWAPPEQEHWESERISEASDIYAIGALFFWLVTGKRPTKDGETNGASDLSNIANGIFDWKGSIRKSLALDDFGKQVDAIREIVRISLAENPEDRCQPVCELKKHFEELLDWSMKTSNHKTLAEHIGNEIDRTIETMGSKIDNSHESLKKSFANQSAKLDDLHKKLASLLQPDTTNMATDSSIVSVTQSQLEVETESDEPSEEEAITVATKTILAASKLSTHTLKGVPRSLLQKLSDISSAAKAALLKRDRDAILTLSEEVEILSSAALAFRKAEAITSLRQCPTSLREALKDAIASFNEALEIEDFTRLQMIASILKASEPLFRQGLEISAMKTALRKHLSQKSLEQIDEALLQAADAIANGTPDSIDCMVSKIEKLKQSVNEDAYMGMIAGLL